VTSSWFIIPQLRHSIFKKTVHCCIPRSWIRIWLKTER